MAIALDAGKTAWELDSHRRASGWLDDAANDNGDEPRPSGLQTVRRFAWLDEVCQDRWMLAWRCLWARFTSPDAPERAELATWAMRRVLVRRSDARWTSVWFRLVAWSVAQGRYDDLDALASAAMQWLGEHVAHPSWPAVWCELKQHAPRLGRTVEGLDALLSLRAAGRDASLPPPRTASPLANGDGVIVFATLSDERLCAFVREWAATRFVRAVITEVREGGVVVDVGAKTFVRSNQRGLVSGEPIDVRVRSFECSGGFARLGELRFPCKAIDETVRVGADEEATVIGRYDHGMEVRFRGFSGSVDSSEMQGRDTTGLTPGGRVRVKVLAIRERSVLLSLASDAS